MLEFFQMWIINSSSSFFYVFFVQFIFCSVDFLYFSYFDDQLYVYVDVQVARGQVSKSNKIVVLHLGCPLRDSSPK